MMEVTFDGDLRFTIHHRGHLVPVDTSTAAGGADSGLPPVELFVGSVGACLGYYALAYCRKHDLDAAGLRIVIEHTMAEHPKRITNIYSRILIPPHISEEHFPGIEALAGACILRNSLKGSIEMPVSVERA
jgi:putative redox protein